MPGLNTDLFDKVADVITERPDNYDQSWFRLVKPIHDWWLQNLKEPDDASPELTDEEIECGTVMCVAGWAAWLEGARPPTGGVIPDDGAVTTLWEVGPALQAMLEHGPHTADVQDRVRNFAHVDQIAREVLGLHQWDAARLFSAGWQPCRSEHTGVVDDTPLADKVALALRCIGRGVPVSQTETMTAKGMATWLAEYELAGHID